MSQQQNIEALNDLLKGEYMAIEIYENTKKLQGDAQVEEMVNKFKDNHK